MLARLSDRLAAFFRATAPDPFVIAVLLTLITILLALLRTDASLRDTISAWAGASPDNSAKLTTNGLWKLLAFAMQMCLILITGHALAASRPISRILDTLAGVPRSAPAAAIIVALVACLLGVINWGFGLVGGAIIARRVGESLNRRGISVHYPLLCACAYVCMMVWHGGLSGSAPLSASTRDGLDASLPKAFAATVEPIPLTNTLFSTLNLVTTGGLLIIIPLAAALLTPRRGIQPITDFSTSSPTADDPPSAETTPQQLGALPRFLENTPFINYTLAALIGVWAFGYYFPAGNTPSGVTNLSLDAVNLSMFMLCLLLHATPRRFISAIDEAAKGCGGIIIQFPLYAGIMGIMVGTGLTQDLADTIAAGSNQTTLPLMTFLAASVINLFIPSGGGQWAVQGPIALEAAHQIGVPAQKMVMAIAYGDQLTNMLQPFWALPLLAITGVKARDIIGYTAVLMVIGGLWISLCLLLL